MVCQEYSHSTRAGIFGTENNYEVTRHTEYGSMQLNYHEGEYLSSGGITMFGGRGAGVDTDNLPNGAGLFHIWHRSNLLTLGLIGSLSQ